MAEIIVFPARARKDNDDDEVDLLTAVDAAIRDLREISQECGEQLVRQRADECRGMLERAFLASAD